MVEELSTAPVLTSCQLRRGLISNEIPFGSLGSEGEQEALLWLEPEVPLLLLILVPCGFQALETTPAVRVSPGTPLSVLAPSADDLQILLRHLT